MKVIGGDSRLHVVVVHWHEVDDVIHRWLDAGWSADDPQHDDGVTVQIFHRQPRGPLGRYRRTQWRVMVTPESEPV